MQNTDNFDLKIYDGEDLFNPLVVENANAQAIDTQMKKNENHTVGDATELVSGTVHALTRLTPDTPMLRFTATSKFTAGDTFTVDGVQVSALTVSGEQLPDGAYIIGSEVLAYLKGTLLTFFTSQGTLATAQNALKLGGNEPEYYATATAVQTAQNTATAAGNLANKVNDSMKSIGDVVPIGVLNATSGTITLTQSLTNFREILFCVNLTGIGVVASSQVAVDYFVNYMNSATSRHIVGTTLDKMYEADFYYASGKINMLNGVNISGVTIFGIK